MIYKIILEGKKSQTHLWPPKKPTLFKITNFQDNFQYFQIVGFLGGWGRLMGSKPSARSPNI